MAFFLLWHAHENNPGVLDVSAVSVTRGTQLGGGGGNRAEDAHHHGDPPPAL